MPNSPSLNTNPAGYAEVKHLQADRLAFFDERDRQTQQLYPRLDDEYEFARAKNKLTLELGCGMGYNAQRLAQNGARPIVMDLAPNAVRLTRERFTLSRHPAQFLIADAEHLPFATEVFEMILSSGVIHHSPNTQAAADEITRVLKRLILCASQRLRLCHSNTLCSLRMPRMTLPPLRGVSTAPVCASTSVHVMLSTRITS